MMGLHEEFSLYGQIYHCLIQQHSEQGHLQAGGTYYPSDKCYEFERL